MNIVKNMMRSNFPMKTSAQSYDQYINDAKITVKQKGVHSLLDWLNVDFAESESSNISHLDVVGLYTATTKDIPMLIRAASKFARTRLVQLYSTHHHFTLTQRGIFGS